MPKPDEYFILYAKAAYYAHARGQLAGNPNVAASSWGYLPAGKQAGWIEVAKAVFKQLNVRDENGEPVVS